MTEKKLEQKKGTEQKSTEGKAINRQLISSRQLRKMSKPQSDLVELKKKT